MRRQRLAVILIILAILIGLLGVVAEYLVRVGGANPPPFVNQHLELLLIFVLLPAVILIALLTAAVERIRERLHSSSETRLTFVQLFAGIVRSLLIIACVTFIFAAAVLIAMLPIVIGQQSIDTQAIWQFFHENGSGISALVAVGSAPVIFITLVIGVVQALRIEKQLRLASITSSSLHFRELNELVVTHRELDDIFGKDDRRRRAGGIFFSTFETRYLFHKEGFIDRDMWASDIESMKDAFNRYPFLSDVRQNNEKLYYRPFREFIDNEILKTSSTQLPPSQSGADASGAQVGDVREQQ